MENLEQLGLVEMNKEDLQETEGGLLLLGLAFGLVLIKATVALLLDRPRSRDVSSARVR